MINIVTRIAIAGTLASGAISNVSHAQESRAIPDGPTIAELRRRQEMERRVPVTVALVDVLPAPDSVPVLILRRPDLSPHDVILLRRSTADGRQLAAAVLHLMLLRERAGDTASVSGTFRLPAARRGPRAWERSEEVRTTRVIARLRSTRTREVPGVGLARATEVHLPSRAMRDAARRGTARVRRTG